ncbi:MAG: hypothetical protein WC437_04840 [Patescibacteria group bacterium]|jgi:hypothetical protein
MSIFTIHASTNPDTQAIVDQDSNSLPIAQSIIESVGLKLLDMKTDMGFYAGYSCIAKVPRKPIYIQFCLSDRRFEIIVARITPEEFKEKISLKFGAHLGTFDNYFIYREFTHYTTINRLKGELEKLLTVL